MTPRRISISIFLLALAAPLAALPASAEYSHPGAKSIAVWFPGKATLKPRDPKATYPAGTQHWLIKGGREPEIFVWAAPRKVEAKVQTNGIDEFGAVLDVLLDKICGWRGPDLGRSLMTRLYKTKSVIPEKRLQGNAGSLFRKRLTVRNNGCRLDLLAHGARWHFFTATISAD